MATGGPQAALFAVSTRNRSGSRPCPGRYSQREVDSQQVEIHGDVAITMGRVRARSGGPDATQRAFSFWYVRVYARATASGSICRTGRCTVPCTKSET